jgi:hypothetical protein
MPRCSWGVLLLVLACRSDDAAPPAAAAVATSAPESAAESASAPLIAESAPPAPADCAPAEDVAILLSPRAPKPGDPLRAMAVSEQSRDAELVIEDSGGKALAQSSARRGGPPFWWFAEVAAAAPGTLRARLRSSGLHACAEAQAAEAGAPRPAGGWSSVWPIERAWDRNTENLFGAWLEKMFDAPSGEQPVWKVLSDVLRDRERNFLHDHLSLGEDSGAKAPMIEPDCADLPYTLRAYFAFKLGLPFGYSRCTRGSATAPPTCARWSSSHTANKEGADPVGRLGNFVRVTLANAVHSGTVRVRGDDDLGDFYPVALTRSSLRPGATYADPYGHILVVVSITEQTSAGGGALFAVDGQPDGTVSRRRFWQGNFLFHDDPVYGGPGFKRFRPVVMEGRNARALKNGEIPDYSLEQYGLGIDGFFAKVDEVLSPAPRDPKQVFLEAIHALQEQVERRVTSVQNAVDYTATHPGIIDMPAGASIFETEGAWEDYSTPSRDMRLLIGMHVVRTLPARIAHGGARFVLPAGKTPADVEKDLTALLDAEAKKRRFSYQRSDGSAWELTLADVLARTTDLEVAYNPNDCPEKRWGAPAGSKERSTCRRQAPPAQAQRMEEHRGWFAARTRPPRP